MKDLESPYVLHTMMRMNNYSLLSKCLITINLWRNIQSSENSVGRPFLPDLDSQNSFLGIVGSAKPRLLKISFYSFSKNSIYQKRNTTSNVDFVYFKAELKTTFQIEYNVAMQNGLLHKHFSK